MAKRNDQADSVRQIIVADDETYVSTMLASKLRQLGHEVRIAHNGLEALELAQALRPDLVITDFQMPVMSGYEMSVKLRNDMRTHDVPVVMLTARGHLLSESELSLTNIRHLCPKPFSARDVLSKVSELLPTVVQVGSREVVHE